MYYLDKLKERARFIVSFLKREEYAAEMGLPDFVHALFKSALFSGRRIKAVAGEPEGGCRSVTIGGRTVYWPEAADPESLVYTYREVFFDRHGHLFDTYGTELMDGDVVLDCGACEGFFTLKALEKGAGRVYAFEPGRSLARCLMKCFSDEISDGRVEVVNKLLGMGNRKLLFREDMDSLASSGVVDGLGDNGPGTYEVEMTSIDEFCKERNLESLDYIKADVEGAEVELVTGARETIRRFGPRISLAVYHQPGNAREIVEFIRSVDPSYVFRYKGLACHDGVVRPMVLHCHKDKAAGRVM